MKILPVAIAFGIALLGGLICGSLGLVNWGYCAGACIGAASVTAAVVVAMVLDG